MAEMQQSMVADSDARQQLAGQVVQWEENLERLHCEQFRLRCYMASLQSGELPNPKVRGCPDFISAKTRKVFRINSLIYGVRS